MSWFLTVSGSLPFLSRQLATYIPVNLNLLAIQCNVEGMNHQWSNAAACNIVSSSMLCAPSGFHYRAFQEFEAQACHCLLTRLVDGETIRSLMLHRFGSACQPKPINRYHSLTSEEDGTALTHYQPTASLLVPTRKVGETSNKLSHRTDINIEIWLCAQSLQRYLPIG